MKEKPDLNIKKVIQAIRGSNMIGIDVLDNMNLMTNTHILLQLTDEEFWEVQCAFKMRETGMYSAQPKGKYLKVKPFPEKAVSLLKEAKTIDKINLIDTHLQTAYGKSAMLYYAREKDYTAVDKRYIEMFDIKTIEQTAKHHEGSILINGKHLVTPMRIYGSNGTTSYLKRLKTQLEATP